MLGNTLTVPELLQNKGIRFEASKKLRTTAQLLPCNGQKQYEPNDSWLQNKQIEKGLKHRRDLLDVERVERGSLLAAAEWLSEESRARVTKKSGQEWTNFGSEENLGLYLSPEEALLLLELNCLELTWEGVALSIQQAYSLLLVSDRPGCTIDEYRVYSHLVRQGYRLQRFGSEDSGAPHPGNIWHSMSSVPRRQKRIHDPTDAFGKKMKMIHCSAVAAEVPGDLEFEANGQSVGGTKTIPFARVQADGIGDESARATAKRSPNDRIAQCASKVENQHLTESKDYASDNVGGAKKLLSELYDNGVINLPGPSNAESNNMEDNVDKNAKLQIISDETLLDDFTIISRWPGTRIRRNAKRMPQRNTGEKSGILTPITGMVTHGFERIENSVEHDPTQVGRATLEMPGNNSNTLKRERTLEVIEVSDDDVEEVTPTKSRMELLNHFPNAISETFAAEQIPRRYLPHNVWPQNISNRYLKWKASNAAKRDNIDTSEMSCVGTSVPRRDAGSRWMTSSTRASNATERSRNNTYGNLLFPGLGPRSKNNAAVKVPSRNTTPRYGSGPVADPNGICTNHRNETSRRGSRSREEYSNKQIQYQPFRDHGVPLAARSDRGTREPHEHVSVQFGTYTSLAVSQSIWGSSQSPGSGLLRRQNLWTNMTYRRSEQNIVHFTPWSIHSRTSRCNSACVSPDTTYQGQSNRTRSRGTCDPAKCFDDDNRPTTRIKTGGTSFKIVSGASSWSETKAKWFDEKTITIEDEDCASGEGAGVGNGQAKATPLPVKPLVDKENAATFAEVCKHLQIIKPATSRNFERLRKFERTEYHRISYNLYSHAENYKKANPGAPAYRIVVLRSDETPFIEAADIVSLRSDARETPIVFACVSPASVTFAEIGTVRIPDVQDDHDERSLNRQL